MFFTKKANSVSPVFSLLSYAIFLISTGRLLIASSYPDTFPSDNEIRRAFIGVRPDETFVSSEIPARRDLYDQFASRYAPKKSLEDVFPKVFLIYRAGQSAECYNDFIDRCCRIFAEQSSGDVFLLSKWPEGPSEPESLFNAVEFPTLIQNPRVRRILLVNPDNLSQRIQFWPKDPDDPDRVETASEDESLEGLLDALTIGAGAAAGGLELLQPSIGAALNPFYVPVDQSITPPSNQDQLPGETRLDSFFVDTASLPENGGGIDSIQFLSADGSQMAGDTQPLFTSISNVGSEAFTADWGGGNANDDMTTFNTISGTDLDWVFSTGPDSLYSTGPDSLFSTAPDESTDLFGSPVKRQLKLRSRACALRPGLEDDLPFLFEGTAPTYSLELDDSTDRVPVPGALPAYATVHVVQRRLSVNPGIYKLDIDIRNSAGQVIGSTYDAFAFPNQRIEVQSAIPYRLQVWTQAGDEHQPVKFQYGPTGVEWDSNDSNPETHDCQTDEWSEDHRELTCKFVF